MNKPTKEEMLETLQYLMDCTGDVESDYADPVLRNGVKAIRALINAPSKCDSCPFSSMLKEYEEDGP